MIAKSEIRSKARAFRSGLSDEAHTRLSGQICLHLLEAEEFVRASTLHSFWPILNRREVDVRPALKAFARSGSVWLPVVRGNELLHTPMPGLDEEDAWPTGPFGQLEPSDAELHSHIHVELILVPGLAYDLHGNRIGYGKGFYDRFLSTTQGLKVGITMQGQVMDDLPTEKHDVRVDAIVTEDGWHWCREAK